MSLSEREHLEELLRIYQGNIRNLEKQKAQLGTSSIPLPLLNDLEYNRHQVEAIMRQLDPASPPSSTDNDLYFVNQHKVFEQIEDERQVDNFIIEAPGGYGKTRLVRELAIRWLALGWHTRIVEFTRRDPNTALHEVAAIGLVAENFIKDADRIRPEYAITDDVYAETVAGRIARFLHDECIKTLRPDKNTGVLLIFDRVDQIQESKGQYQVLNHFFKHLRQAMRQYRQYDRIRIVLAGRNIGHHYPILSGAMIIPLAPFSRETIQRAIELKYQELTEDRHRALAECTLYATGGHPGMIHRALTDPDIGIVHKHTMAPRRWLQTYRTQIEQQILQPVVEELRDQFARQDLSIVWEALQALCVYRKFTRPMAKSLFAQFTTFEQMAAFELVDQLKLARMFSYETPYLSDGVLRPALVRWLQLTDSARFDHYCQIAYVNLENELPHPRDIDRAKVIVELFYILLLQQHAIVLSFDNTPLVRKNTMNMVQQKLYGLIEKTVAGESSEESGYALQTLLEGIRDSLEKDSDLKVLFKYTLADDTQPNDDLYQSFISELCNPSTAKEGQ